MPKDFLEPTNSNNFISGDRYEYEDEILKPKYHYVEDKLKEDYIKIEYVNGDIVGVKENGKKEIIISKEDIFKDGLLDISKETADKFFPNKENPKPHFTFEDDSNSNKVNTNSIIKDKNKETETDKKNSDDKSEKFDKNSTNINNENVTDNSNNNHDNNINNIENIDKNPHVDEEKDFEIDNSKVTDNDKNFDSNGNSNIITTIEKNFNKTIIEELIQIRDIIKNSTNYIASNLISNISKTEKIKEIELSKNKPNYEKVKNINKELEKLTKDLEDVTNTKYINGIKRSISKDINIPENESEEESIVILDFINGTYGNLEERLDTITSLGEIMIESNLPLSNSDILQLLN